jgi:hypothetical protein
VTELQGAARKHSDKAEKRLRDAYEEVADILLRTREDVEILAEKASK